MTTLGAVVSNTTLSRQLILNVNDFRFGVTSPTSSTLGTTPTVPTLLFANTNELLTVGEIMPLNWDRTVDVDLIMFWALAVGETNLDTLDITYDYVVPLNNTGGAGPDKASTGATGQFTAVTGRLAVADIYSMTTTFNRADATNPYTSSDAIGFAIEVHMTNTTGVGSAHFLGGCLSYEALH